MKLPETFVKPLLATAVAASLLVAAAPASAHCDGVDGPVVGAARKALDANDVNLALIWVQPADEGVVREAFRKTQAVRKLSPTAKELADHHFFETIVRVHRSGEGEPYTGLKAAGRDLGPAVPAGDKALETGSVEPVLKLLTDEVHRGLEARYREVAARKGFKADDVAAGQKYVQAYVDYIHAVEKVYDAAATGTHPSSAAAAAPVHRH